MHVKECIEAGNHNPGRVQLKVCSVLHLAAASMQRAAGSVLSPVELFPFAFLNPVDHGHEIVCGVKTNVPRLPPEEGFSKRGAESHHGLFGRQ